MQTQICITSLLGENSDYQQCSVECSLPNETVMQRMKKVITSNYLVYITLGSGHALEMCVQVLFQKAGVGPSLHYIKERFRQIPSQ